MQVFWIKIDKIKYRDLFEKIVKLETQNIVFTQNQEILLKTLKDKEFESLINKATYNTSDWIGLYIAYQIIDNNYNKFINISLLPYFFFNLFFRRKFLYEKYGERICGSDLTKDLVEYSEKNNIKVTIIDFWASWCGPCRVENPNVVALYNEFHAQGLNIIGVSLDKDAAKWKEAIAKDKLTWAHVSNLKFWDEPIAKQYNVQSIPATFILDAKGNIVAKDLRGDALKAKVKELLGVK